MNTEKFVEGTRDRRQAKSSAIKPYLTIAQSIRRSSDPHHAAITSFSRQEILRGEGKHAYYFEDGSYLIFKVSYAAVEDGCRQ